MKKKLFLVSFIVSMTICLQAQQFYPLDQPVLPPSPSSTSVMKFAAIPPGLSSGIIPVNIQLMSLPGRSLSASVGLAYHASGVKVAETPGPIGSNWGLITGGLITRTMYSRPDEMSEGYLKWKELAGDNWSFGSDTIENFAKGTWDSQPDVFHYMFPGHTGKFVFGLNSDGNDTIYTIPHSLMKIEWNDSDTIIEEFKITTENGTRYYFGKSLDGNREAIESAECDPFYTGGVSFDYNSAWYLLQVISPRIVDTINYFYSTCNESVDYAYAEAHYYPIWTYPTDASITSQSEEYKEIISYSVPILDSITAASGQIYCYHSGNRLDIPAGKKVDSLALINYLGEKIKSYQFDYTHFSCGTDSLDKRLALDEITEIGSDGSEKPSYSFTYHYGNSLPSRDSDKQDYWGYYNNNSENFMYSAYWDQDGASRITDTTRVKYGLLKKIDFPTGGYKEFHHEANYISKKRNYGITSQPNIYETLSADWDSVTGNTGDTIRFFLPFTQDVRITYTLSGFIPEFKGYLKIDGDSDSWSSPTPCDDPVEYGDEYENLLAGEYSIILHTSIPDQSAEVVVIYQRYRDFIAPYSTSDAYVGGTRIKKVILYDDISSSNNIETNYAYCDTISSNESSGVLTDFLSNHHYEYRYDHNDSSSVFFARYARLNSLLFDGGYHLGYGSYQISQGDSNGTTMVSTISPSEQVNVSTEEFPYSYPTSAGWKRGQVSESYTFDSDDALRSESYQTYATYDAENDPNRTVINGLKASLNSTLGIYDKDDIKYVSSWSHPVYQKSVSHPVNSGNSITQEQEFYFDNPKHMKLARKEVKTSDGDSIYSRITYPLDYGSGNNNSKSQAITYLRDTFNMQGVPIETYTYRGNDLLSASCNTFKVVSGIVYPDTAYAYDLEEPLALTSFDTARIDGSDNFILDDNYRALNAIDEIDSYNRIQEAHAIHGNPSVTLFGYNALYPIASFSNASSDEIAYSSFECEQKGNFTYSEANITTDACAITGEKILSSGNLSKSGLSSGNYFLTFWGNSAPTISVTNGSYSLIDNTSVNRQGWRYFQYKITANGSTTVSLSSISKVDEVRLFPFGSFVTTKTYDPLIGVTSQAGANSIPSYITYDTFGRPEKIKDQDKYIIREYEYNYANQ